MKTHLAMPAKQNPASRPSGGSAYGRYSPIIREYIRDLGWKQLHQVQEEACRVLMDSADDLLVVSSTSSGKTEAVFFPLLSMQEGRKKRSCSILYISPLKALINDQFDRLEGLLEKMEMPLTPWHGDVSYSLRQKLLKKPQGIVQMTPESLEALLALHPGNAIRLFCDLDAVIIDEAHAFAGTDRGIQLSCLLARLERLISRDVRRIGLSATVSDIDGMKAWMCAGRKNPCQVAGREKVSRTIGLALKVYSRPDCFGDWYLPKELHKDLYKYSLTNRALVFCKSRHACETAVEILKKQAATEQEKNCYEVHHSSVSAAARRETEHRLRQPGQRKIVCTTSTLELGIDIGDLDYIIQLGACSSISSLVQRLGRSGRRSGKSKMLFLITYGKDDVTGAITMPWDFLMTLAMTDLYIEQQYTEPFYLRKKPFDLAAQQTLSILYQMGEMTLPDLARAVLSLPAFSQIEPQEYLTLLKDLKQLEYIEQTETGTILPSDKTDRLVHHYSFYSVFETAQEWTIVCEREIGRISAVPFVGQVLRLAGQGWMITALDYDTHRAYAKPSAGGQAPVWSGGSFQTDNQVVERVREILAGKQPVLPLGSEESEILEIARLFVSLQDCAKRTISRLPSGQTVIYTWAGTRVTESLCFLLASQKKALNIESVGNGDWMIVLDGPVDESQLTSFLASLTKESIAQALMSVTDQKEKTKYSFLVPEDLWQTAWLTDCNPIDEVLQLTAEIVKA